jgi:GT2 family glycosyltransferase
VLDGIEAQVIPDEVDLRVVIIDNSQDANARRYVDNRKQEYPFSLMYLNERGPGITYPRNRGVEEALKGKDDYIIFTDDDVLVDKNWINELFSVAEETEAAAVSGAVKAKYKREPPWWIEKGGFFEVVDSRVIVSYEQNAHNLATSRVSQGADEVTGYTLRAH